MKQFFALFMLLVIAASTQTAQKDAPAHRIILSTPTELEKFLSHMAERESNNTPHIVNQYGMMGKYQFSPSTVKILGFNVSRERFLQDTRLQDTVMVAYMRANYRDLKDLIQRHEGKRFKGVLVTRAGVLAAAHLGGSANVRRYFADASDANGRTDANGTSLRHYLEEFNHYKLQERF